MSLKADEIIRSEEKNCHKLEQDSQKVLLAESEGLYLTDSIDSSCVE